MTEPGKAPQLEDLSDADLVGLRNAAIVHGQMAFAEAMDRARDQRSNPELFRHSRRR